MRHRRAHERDVASSGVARCTTATAPRSGRPRALADELLGARKGTHGSGMWACPDPQHAQTGRTPPVSVFRSRRGEQRWRCHGCGAGGTAIDLVMAVARCDVREAFDILARRSGSQPEPAQPAHRPVATIAHVLPGPDFAEYVTRCGGASVAARWRSCTRLAHERTRASPRRSSRQCRWRRSGSEQTTATAWRSSCRTVCRPPGDRARSTRLRATAPATPATGSAEVPERLWVARHQPEGRPIPARRAESATPSSSPKDRSTRCPPQPPDIERWRSSAQQQPTRLSPLASRRCRDASSLPLTPDPAGMAGTERLVRMLAELQRPVAVLNLPDGVNDLNDWMRAEGSHWARSLAAAASPSPTCALVVIHRIAPRNRSSPKAFRGLVRHGGEGARCRRGSAHCRCRRRGDRRGRRLGRRVARHRGHRRRVPGRVRRRGPRGDSSPEPPERPRVRLDADLERWDPGSAGVLGRDWRGAVDDARVGRSRFQDLGRLACGQRPPAASRRRRPTPGSPRVGISRRFVCAVVTQGASCSGAAMVSSSQPRTGPAAVDAPAIAVRLRSSGRHAAGRRRRRSAGSSSGKARRSSRRSRPTSSGRPSGGDVTAATSACTTRPGRRVRQARRTGRRCAMRARHSARSAPPARCATPRRRAGSRAAWTSGWPRPRSCSPACCGSRITPSGTWPRLPTGC